jgi:hypothetical protein
MKRNQIKRWLSCAALAAAGLASGAAQADTVEVTVDLSGISSNGAFGDATNTVLSILAASNARVTGIGWEASLFADFPSLLSEMSLDISSPSYASNGLTLAPGFADFFAGAGSYSSNGLIDLVALGADFAIAGDGLLRLEFFEAVDDFDGADGIWRQGTLTIQYNTPEPASLALAGLALAGAAGATRRRKAAAPAA